MTSSLGAIIHHAFAEKPALDEKGGSVSQGYLICGIMNRIFYSFVIYTCIIRSKRLRAAFNPIATVGLTQCWMWIFLRTVKRMHPIYHEMVNNGTYVEFMENAWPYTVGWRAYYHAGMCCLYKERNH